MNSQKPAEKSYNNNNSRSIKSSRARRRIIYILFGSVLGIVLLCLAAVGAISHYNKSQDKNNGTLIFYEPDYDYDIMKDEEYLDLDRDIYFTNPDNGMTSAIVNGNLEDVPTIQHKHVALLCSFIDYAIKGQTKELNSLFSDAYIEADGKLKMSFTMQQLYNIKITYIDTSSVEVNGETHVSYDYWLEYMIRENNGTFRNDMESDCIRKEYVRVTERNGLVEIDVLAPYKTTNKVNDPLNSISVIIIVALIIVIASIVVFTIILLKKSRIKK